MKTLLLAPVVAAACLTALPAAAQFQKSEDAIKYRQSAFTLIANHFGRVGAMAQGRIPFDAAAAARDAALAASLSTLPFTAFGEGTDMGRPNRAKPEIWSRSADFQAKAKDMQAALAKLDDAAKTGDQGAIRTAAGAVGGACKACHDDYRAENYSN
jgi:cytochrome c556